MEVDLTHQAMALGGACLLGLIVGLFYDLLRILRTRIPIKLLGGVLDFLFWLCCTAALFLYCVAADQGEVRGYTVLFLFLGGSLYFLLLSPLLLPIGYALADLVLQIVGICTFPLRLLWRLCKKFWKFAKKNFLYWLKWFRIDLIFFHFGGRPSRAGASPRGGISREAEKSRPAHQRHRTGAAHLHVHHPAQPSDPHPGDRGRP